MSILKDLFGGDPRDSRQSKGYDNSRQVTTALKTEEEIIQEIHDGFDSAQEELLKQALKVLEENKVPEKDRIKAETLRWLGFGQTEEVKKLNENDVKTALSKQIAHDVIYYRDKYPFLKFLTIGELDRICTKYGLVHADVLYYIGKVPDKNILDIVNAQKLALEDYPYKGSPGRFENIKTKETAYFRFMIEPYGLPAEILDKVDSPEDWRYVGGQQTHSNFDYGHPAVTKPLQIAAPQAMFNMTNLKREGNALVSKDPIVFRYVRGGIQVLTKWGLEASDSALINPVNN